MCTVCTVTESAWQTVQAEVSQGSSLSPSPEQLSTITPPFPWPPLHKHSLPILPQPAKQLWRVGCSLLSKPFSSHGFNNYFKLNTAVSILNTAVSILLLVSTCPALACLRCGIFLCTHRGLHTIDYCEEEEEGVGTAGDSYHI